MIIRSLWIRGLGGYSVREKRGAPEYINPVKAIIEIGLSGRFKILEHNGAEGIVCGKPFHIKYKIQGDSPNKEEKKQ